jgi:hypothetical protein
MPRPVPIVLALLALQATLVLLFVTPARAPEPHGLPVGVAGPAPATAPVQRALAARDGAFEVHTYSGAAEARTAIREREVYGALVPAEGRVLVASAAGPAAAQQLRELAAGAAAGAAQGGATPGGATPGAATPGAAPGAANGLHFEDVVPVASGDARGAALNLLFLPLMIACFPLAALLGRMGLPRWRALGVVGGFSVLSGLGLSAMLRAMDALPGPYLAVSAVAALIVAAVALTASGLFRVLGPAGLGLAAVLFVVLGNPGSGNAAAPELLPGFWRVAGQLLPPGAGGQALRDVAYFDGHAMLAPVVVLGAWALIGATLMLVRRERPARQAAAAAPEPRIAVPA